ncbi:unnamed protein product [Rotaria sp. Silwood2]|nr:unnamed protein product [Rotaria sp. Silwood2]CAF2520745.1 unnamed protein product [Rotaria sp. Silwood2]CAF2921519.1 unnamed protein product [Rotaria sp. Silwood2]CAF3317861.1 unnamed protein product [Rotaria sp. Silwood2]CAF3854856.1 unnamed protein product [Rotaria sp. Silwood2]
MSSHHGVQFRDLTSLPTLIPTPQYINDIDELQNPVFEVKTPLQLDRQHRIKIKMLLDIVLFVALLAAGLVLFASVGQNILLRSFGAAFLIAGIILVILSAWLVLTGPSMFRKMNLLKMATALIVLLIGIALVVIADEQNLLVVGYALFATALLILITKYFFLVEDEQIRIQRLERELRKAKQSAGMGMALSYFYNFIVPTAANIRSLDEGHTPIDMEITRGQFEEYQLKNDQLFIIVPRDLDGSDIKVFLKNLSSPPNPSIIQGKPKERPGNDTHRPMFVYFLEWNPTTKECDGLFDIPTIISSCWDRYRNEKKNQDYTVDVTDEIVIFQNQLLALVNEHPITNGKVRILSFPSLPFRFSDIKYAVTQLAHYEI